ncbi:MAG: Tetratricopeptide 2 repeat protein [Edaphobacter sp.]|nr:Tetratricopeptide 2 repeat protein [Edaphobacter sp.]
MSAQRSQVTTQQRYRRFRGASLRLISLRTAWSLLSSVTNTSLLFSNGLALFVLASANTNSLQGQPQQTSNGRGEASQAQFRSKAEASAAADKCLAAVLELESKGNLAADESKLQAAQSDLACALNADTYLNNYGYEVRDLEVMQAVDLSAGKLTEASAIAHQELDLALRHGDNAGAERIRMNLKMASIPFGTPDNALEVFQATLKDQSPNHEQLLPLANIGLATLYARKGEFARCIAYSQSAEKLLTNKPRTRIDELLRPVSLLILGSTYAKCHEPAKGIELITQASKLEIPSYYKIDRMTDRWAKPQRECAIDTALAIIQYDEGDKAGARLKFQPCLNIEQSSSDVGYYATLMHLFQDSDPAFSILVGKYAVNLVQHSRQALSGMGPEAATTYTTWHQDTYRELAGILITAGRFWEAKQILDLLKEKEFGEFIQRGSDSAPAGSASITAADAQPLIALDRERGALAGKEHLTRDEQARKAYLDARFKATKLAASHFFDETGNLRKVNIPASASHQGADELAIAVGLQKDLQPGEVAVYTLVREDRYDALLITDKLMVPWHYSISRGELRRKVFAFYQQLSNRRANPVDSGQELFRIIVGDLDKELKEANATTVLWSLDDVLRYIPMGALYDGNQYLVQRFSSAIYNKVSGRALESRDKWRVLGAGVSKGSAADGLEPLASVPDELHAIVHADGDPGTSGVLPGRILLDPEFTASSFRAGLNQGFSVVHIASHFIFDPGGDSASFLLLGDGKLSLADIRANDDYRFNGIRLLTLSACQTAAAPTGEGLEIDGLGFLVETKGAHAVLASLWSVDDVSTEALMAAFYTELSVDRTVTKAEALRRAQISLMNKTLKGDSGADVNKARTFGQPYFWAPFILLGNAN